MVGFPWLCSLGKQSLGNGAELGRTTGGLECLPIHVGRVDPARQRQGALISRVHGLRSFRLRGVGRPLSDDCETCLNRLLRGIATHDTRTVRLAWRALLATPAMTAPAVQARLDTPTWTKPPSGPSDRYLGVLLALLDAVDAEAFGAEIERLTAQRLHPLHRRTVELLAKRRGERPFGTLDCGVPVHIADDVPEPAGLLRRMNRWSRTKELSIADVTRVDVILGRPELDYLGLYAIRFDAIVLVWRPTLHRFPLVWFSWLDHERTFYHEIGHHHFGHHQGGQDIDQEQEANAYATRMLRRAHPVAMRLLALAVLPVLRLRRLKRRWLG